MLLVRNQFAYFYEERDVVSQKFQKSMSKHRYLI